MTTSAAPHRLHDAVSGRLEKIQPHHRDRLAIVYVRQSSPQQVLDHRESTQLQYDLVARAQAFGWATRSSRGGCVPSPMTRARRWNRILPHSR